MDSSVAVVMNGLSDGAADDGLNPKHRGAPVAVAVRGRGTDLDQAPNFGAAHGCDVLAVPVENV
jgi:hypothetical protein